MPSIFVSLPLPSLSLIPILSLTRTSRNWAQTDRMRHGRRHGGHRNQGHRRLRLQEPRPAAWVGGAEASGPNGAGAGVEAARPAAWRLLGWPLASTRAGLRRAVRRQLGGPPAPTLAGRRRHDPRRGGSSGAASDHAGKAEVARSAARAAAGAHAGGAKAVWLAAQKRLGGPWGLTPAGRKAPQLRRRGRGLWALRRTPRRPQGSTARKALGLDRWRRHGRRWQGGGRPFRRHGQKPF
jgi:hypothetical protein